jgi:rsbT co-antagonist protein RsbR
MNPDGSSDDGEPAFTSAVLAQLAGAMMAIACVEYGDYEVRVELELSERHPFTPLMRSINEMIEWLAVAKRQRDEHLTELRASQRAALLELSSPLIEVMPGVLCLPVIGVVDEERGAKMTDDLLARVARGPVRRVVIDVTGIRSLDDGALRQLVRMIKSVKLLGTEGVLSGLGPDMARTAVESGLDFAGIATYRTLGDAIRVAIGAAVRGARTRL